VGGEAEVAPARALAASAWAFRWQVEVEASGRFERLADRLEQTGAAAELVALAQRSAADERRHAGLCAEQAALRGQDGPWTGAAPPPEIAPGGLPLRERVLYELVAGCCIAETASVAVLTALLEAARGTELQRVLRALARDEVQHARLGWAALTVARRESDVAFLSPFLPAMLGGHVDPDLYAPVTAEREDPALLEHGVLPHRLQRTLFERSLREVILPGLERLGVEVLPARRWLAEQRAGARRLGVAPA